MCSEVGGLVPLPLPLLRTFVRAHHRDVGKGAGAEPRSMPSGSGLGKGGTVTGAVASATSAVPASGAVAKVVTPAVVVTVTKPQAATQTPADTIGPDLAEGLHKHASEEVAR